MKRSLFGIWRAGCASTLFLLAGAAAYAQAIPASIIGSWRIVKILPTHHVTCWGDKQARPLIGSALTYRPHAMLWKGGEVAISEALSRKLSGGSFLDEYKVGLPELGIRATEVTEIDLQHEDMDITGATTEVPGDTIVLAGPGRIVVSACGVFYEAVRAAGGR